MDPFAHRLANAVAGNPRDAATLEVTLAGPTLGFREPRTFAVVGASFDLFLDDAPVPLCTAVYARRDSVLRFGARHTGARAYVAVNGGFDVPPVLGSRATHVPTGIGGWRGRALQRGDRLPLGPERAVPRPGMAAFIEEHAGAPAVRILPGLQREKFADDATATFVSSDYAVSVESNRMGYRLTGPMVRLRGAADIISDVTPLGTVQIPASGQPVLLMADRQTSGGYARLAVVISADIGIAGQIAPGERLAFRLCDHATALSALVARERRLQTLEARCV
jgi:antagonist of KipI